MGCEVRKRKGRKVGVEEHVYDKYKDDGMAVGDMGVVDLALD